jgi:N-carbamoylputrescine amidase
VGIGEGLDLFVELINIALIQSSDGKGKTVNWTETKRLITEAANGGANVIVLQELFLGAYFCYEENVALLDNAIRSDDSRILEAQALAKELSIVLFFSFYEKDLLKNYNSVLCIDTSGEQLGVYRKSHIPNDPGYYEKFYFAEGNTGVQVFETKFGRIAPLICFDQWFPEAARIAALKGAQLIVYPTAIGWDLDTPEALKEEELDAWITIQRAHAIANGVYVASVNRVGEENGKVFWGNSFVCGPLGRVLNRGGGQDQVVSASIDLTKIQKTRSVWTFLHDRRPDLYDELIDGRI